MTLYNVIRELERIAMTHPNVRTAKDGSVYEIMNASPSVKYGAFVVTQNQHYQQGQFDHYGLTLFFIDRLVSDMEDNRLQIQSFAKQVLGNIINVFCEEYDLDVPIIRYQPFTQKFADECAGQYAQIELEIPLDILCPEEYE